MDALQLALFVTLRPDRRRLVKWSNARSPAASRRPDLDAGLDPADSTKRLLMTHVIEDTGGRFLGAMVVARNIGYLSQVQST